MSDRNWADLDELQELSGAPSLSETMRAAVRHHLERLRIIGQPLAPGSKLRRGRCRRCGGPNERYAGTNQKLCHACHELGKQHGLAKGGAS
jgi:hypothetical protein